MLITACQTEPRDEPAQHLPRPEDPSLTLLVTNQSFEHERVSLTIKIDGELAVTGDFDVEGQHTWVPFDFAITPGEHALSISTETSAMSFERPFTMTERNWGVVSYWGEEEVDRVPIELTVSFYDEEPHFD